MFTLVAAPLLPKSTWELFSLSPLLGVGKQVVKGTRRLTQGHY